ncbi:MAG TPA: PadR family transcriptional regulator, partial [Acidimicrobiales bacterium]
MVRIFGHGGLRLVLLSLLEDGPKHGYELIIGIEDRFMGMYRPSSGTVYPRLAALEEEGLISGTDSGGKRIYALTDAGRAELSRRRTELDDTVTSATTTVRAVMDDIQAEVRSTIAAVQADLEDAVAQARRHAGGVADTVSAAEAVTREAWRASEDARRLAVDEARR